MSNYDSAVGQTKECLNLLFLRLNRGDMELNRKYMGQQYKPKACALFKETAGG